MTPTATRVPLTKVPANKVRAIAAVVALTLLVGFGAGACGGSKTNTASGASSASSSAADASGPTGKCASAGTKHFPKTRLVADLGIAYGAFHRYLYKPYQAGTFTKGASGRTSALIKAALATAAITKLLSNAVNNAQADPTLCQYVPTMSSISSALSTLRGKLVGGAATAGDLAAGEGLFSQLKSKLGFGESTTGIPGLG